jgi:hypothetical protein
MSIPGFDADAALSPPRQSYRARAMVWALGVSGSVTPQIGWPYGMYQLCLCRWYQKYDGKYGPWEWGCKCYGD